MHRRVTLPLHRAGSVYVYVCLCVSVCICIVLSLCMCSCNSFRVCLYSLVVFVSWLSVSYMSIFRACVVTHFARSLDQRMRPRQFASNPVCLFYKGGFNLFSPYPCVTAACLFGDLTRGWWKFYNKKGAVHCSDMRHSSIKVYCWSGWWNELWESSTLDW